MYSWTLGAVLLAAHVDGFSFSFSNKPTQCGGTTVTVDGGTPPYRLVMVPSGPLVNRPEIRTIVDQQFSSTSFTLPPLGFPGGSNFTAVMGDANGVGTGGTSVITDVANSADESCLSTTPTNPLFYLQLPANPSLVQCGSMDITFSDSAQGDVTLMGLIPGGTSFSVPVPSGSRSTTWSPITVTAGTGVMLVAGDSRGRGTGGSAFIMIIQNGSDSCLNSGGGSGVTVYSSTNAPFAGGQYATGSGGGTVTGPWQGSPSSGSSNSGGTSDPKTRTAIIAGVVCGVVALIAIVLCAFFIWRRRRTQKARRYGGTKEVDLLKSDRHPAPVAVSDGHTFEPTPFYTPPRQSFNNSSNHRSGTPPHTPGQGHRPSTSISTMEGGFNPTVASHDPLVPPSAWNPNAAGAAAAAAAGAGGAYGSSNYRSNASSNRSDVDGMTDLGSGSNGSEYNYRPSSPVTSKSAEGPSRLQPLNIIQHEDAGAVANTPAPAQEGEVVELPPSYNDVRQAAGAAPVANVR